MKNLFGFNWEGMRVCSQDIVAEWLRRWTWNPLGFPAQVRILPISFFTLSFTLNYHHILSPLLHSCLLENLIDHQQYPLALRLTSKNKGSQGFLDLRLVMVVGYDVIGFESLQSLLNFFLFFLDILVFQQTFVKFTLLSCIIEAILGRWSFFALRFWYWLSTIGLKEINDDVSCTRVGDTATFCKLLLYRLCWWWGSHRTLRFVTFCHRFFSFLKNGHFKFLLWFWSWTAIFFVEGKHMATLLMPAECSGNIPRISFFKTF